jgi:hypothetical protein
MYLPLIAGVWSSGENICIFMREKKGVPFNYKTARFSTVNTDIETFEVTLIRDNKKITSGPLK